MRQPNSRAVAHAEHLKSAIHFYGAVND